jgi:hypothetical protein
MLVRFTEESSTNKENSEVKELETEVKEINEVEVEVKKITSDDIEEFSKEAGKLEATIVEEPYKPTQEEIDRLQAELDKLLSKKLETTEEVIEESVVEDELSEENNEEPQVRQINRLTYSPRNDSNTEN